MNPQRILMFALLSIALLSAVACARDEAGLGIMIGAPTGVSGKLWKSDTRAFDAALGWSLSGTESFYMHADYLVQDPRQFTVSEGTMPYYYGIGARLRNDNGEEGRFGVRVPLGLEYLLQDAPINIFIEIALVLDLTPKTEGDLNAGVGVRYRFKTPR